MKSLAVSDGQLKALYWTGGAFLAASTTYLLVRKTETRLRRRVVSVALSEIPAPNPVKYWNNVLVDPNSPPKEWCGAFALYSLHQAGLARTIPWERGIGFLYRLRRMSGEYPKPGDIAYFEHNQHHAIVQSVNTNGTVTLINGNGIGGAISISHPALSQVTTFYSIDPLIAAALS